MKVLLIASNRERHPWPVPPIGACCIASSLEASGFEVELLDLVFSERPARDIREKVSEFLPDLVGVSIRNIDNVDVRAPLFYLDGVKEDVIAPLRSATTAPLVIGGAAVSIMPARILDYTGADYAICGEGELVFAELADAIRTGRDPAGLPGVVKRGGEDTLPGNAERIPDLDLLPPPRVHRWVDWKRYRHMCSSYPVQTKRGCALNCSYCVYNSIEGSRYRLRSPDSVVDEIEDILGSCSPGVIEFTDSTFNIPLEHALALCREIVRRRIRCAFNTMGINPGAVTSELVELMREAGFSEVSCTPESGSDRMLSSLGKGFTTAEVGRTARLLEGAGMPVIWYFMFGAPGEDESTVMETFEFIEGNISGRDLVFITGGIRVLPGSPLHEYASAEGGIPVDVDLLRPVWFRPEGIDPDRLAYIIDREVITHPNYINLQDNTDDTLSARIIKGLYSRMGIRTPIWMNIMRRDRLYRLTGANRRKLRRLERHPGRHGNP